jgi:hypothetical protein
MFCHTEACMNGLTCSNVAKQVAPMNNQGPCNRPWKAHRVVRRRGSHIFYTIGSQMAVRMSALGTGRPLPTLTTEGNIEHVHMVIPNNRRVTLK